MKIDIKNEINTRGFFKKETFYAVNLVVQLTEEEKAIIKEHKLENLIIMNRPFPAASGGGGVYNLTYKDLLDGNDHYNLHTPNEAKEYKESLIERLKAAKEYLENTATPTEDTSIEI
jgi:hypothetical protein